MNSFELEEAQLYRILSRFFGAESVIPKMSVLAVCGGNIENIELDAEFKASIYSQSSCMQLNDWAKQTQCLFTIVDQNDQPKLVVEFSNIPHNSDPNNVVDLYNLNHQMYAKPILQKFGINYVCFTKQELNEVLDPNSKLNFTNLISEKLNIPIE